jgi:hypothetical protein
VTDGKAEFPTLASKLWWIFKNSTWFFAILLFLDWLTYEKGHRDTASIAEWLKSSGKTIVVFYVLAFLLATITHYVVEKIKKRAR